MEKKGTIPREVYCPICTHIMYECEYAPMKLDPCGHIICENCILSWNFSQCPICYQNIITYRRDSDLPVKYKDIIENKSPLNEDEVCNFIKYSTNLVEQVRYKCITCQGDDGNSNSYICETCAKICHKGHITLRFGKGLVSGCCCGQNHLLCACKCLSPNHRVPICTLSLKKALSMQHGYSCSTCNLSFVCNACAEKCHRGHALHDIGITDQVCQCGMGHGLAPCRCYHPESVENMTIVTPTIPQEEKTDET